jgi:hypothetical protein
MDDLEVWRTAGTFISLRSADEAVPVAARRIDALLDQGDAEGYFVWKRVTQAIDDLWRSKPRSDDLIH